MQPFADQVTDMPQEGLALSIDGRTYGDDREPDHLGSLRRMPVPPQMEELRAALERHSQLLALPEASAPAIIYDAFGKDLQLLARYRDAFRQAIDAAVRARALATDETAQAHLDPLTEQISEVVFEPTLDLGPAAVQLAPAELLRRLQDQFRADTDMLVRSVAVWLHVLAESQFVSVVEWFNPRAIRYHYFRMETQQQELHRERKVSGDIFTGRTVTTTTTTQNDLVSERRTHTVVNAEVHAPEAYLRRVPQRIADLIDATPPEVRPFLSIIDGMISQEQVHRRITESKVETTTRSVYIPDPALALFNTWAINGWGGSTEEAARSVYRDHPLSTANKYLIAEVIGTVIVAGLSSVFEGPRGGLVLAFICAILIAFHQLGMRLPPSR